MKWLIGIVTALVLTLSSSGCGFPQPDSAAAYGARFVTAEMSIPGGTQAALAKFTKADVTTTNSEVIQSAAEIARQQSILQTLNENTVLMNKMLTALKKREHKTWYVFSGATPAGWDCSGLVLWAYEQVGVTLPHRASEQMTYGTLTKTPQPGDIVGFTYKGSKSAYHVGIYLGEGMMIHAPRPGTSTTIESIEKFANGSKISYTHILDSLL